MEKDHDCVTLYLFRPYIAKEDSVQFLFCAIPIFLGILLVYHHWIVGIVCVFVLVLFFFLAVETPQYRKIILTPLEIQIYRKPKVSQILTWDRITAMGSILDTKGTKHLFFCLASVKRLRSFKQKHGHEYEKLSESVMGATLTEQERMLLIYLWRKTTHENANLLLFPYKDSILGQIAQFCEVHQIEIPFYVVKLENKGAVLLPYSEEDRRRFETTEKVGIR